ncbi:hypothetical protein bcgnr5380_46880 [Bacillus cereus]
MSVAFRKKFGSIKIRMPKNLRHKKISYIEIVPKQKGRFFEVHYTYEMHMSQMKKQYTTTSNALSCDLGVDRLLSCITNTGDAFLIDGDYFELFSCWVGDEDKERVGELKINHFNIDKICIPERTLVRIEK